ncbi:MAG: GtrA family protein [Oscillospiraceae bacterium]
MIKKVVEKVLANEGLMYLIVGGTNTVLSWALTFILGTVFHFGYWVISIVPFVLGVVYSYVLNRRFTFKAADVPLSETLPKFIVNVLFCYALAYVAAKPAIGYVLAAANLDISADMLNVIKVICSNILYIALNYLGQKFFAFKKPAASRAKESGEAGK